MKTAFNGKKLVTPLQNKYFETGILNDLPLPELGNYRRHFLAIM